MAISLPIVSKFDDKGVNGAEKAIGKLQGTLNTFAGIAVAAFSVDAIVDFARDAISAAESVQTANARIGQIAKSTEVFGNETAKVTKRLIEFAEANELRLGVDAEVIKGIQGQLLSFKALSKSATIAGGAFDRATEAAFNMAAAGFGSAESNATALGKALEDPIRGLTALRRSGTLFTEQQVEQIRVMQEAGDIAGAQNLILAELESQYGGVAEATATASERMGILFGNLQEQVGLALLPLLEQIVPIFADFMAQMQEDPVFNEFLNGMVGIFQNMLESLPTVLENLQSFGKDALPAIEAFFPALNEALDLLGQIFFGLEDADPASTTNDFASAMESLAGALRTVRDAIAGVSDAYGRLPTALRMNLFEILSDPLRFARPESWFGEGNVPWRRESGKKAPKTAKGGFTAMPGLQWVGERGPELLSLPKGATVTPIPQHMRADQMMGANSGGNGGNTFAITVNAGMGADGTSIGEEIVKQIKRYERSSGPVFARA